MSLYKVEVDHQDFTMTSDDVQGVDVHQLSEVKYHLLRDKKAFDICVVAVNNLEKKMTIAVNGNPYNVCIQDSYDMMVAQMGLLEAVESVSNDITAPMPGYIIEILVKAGESIENGSPLFILSAMKMENIILSDGIGVVKAIHVNKEESVEKGQLIIEMEDEAL